MPRSLVDTHSKSVNMKKSQKSLRSASDKNKLDHNIDENVMSLARTMFTNMLLLGMDVEDMECNYKIAFNKDMFNEYNKSGSEAVMYFLFNNLNPTLCNEQFRDCWPILDKKMEFTFRKICYNWLVSIKKNDKDSHWPVLNASSLQFPGRSKFIHILYSFSTHVLKQSIKTELDQRQALIYPLLPPRSTDLAEIMSSTIQDAQSLDLKEYLNQMHITNSGHQMWKTYVDELVKDCREISKTQRDIEQEKRASVSLLAEVAVKQGCILPVKRTLNMFDGERDVTRENRQQRLQRVKSLWEKVMHFNEKLEHGREVVRSVLDNHSSKQKLDASDIGIRIPGLLLKKCEREIRQQQIDNVYVSGHLNLLSVLQLWNLCLILYSESLEAENLPDVSKEVPSLTSQAHKFHSVLMQIQAVRKEMSSAFIPDVEHTIQEYRRNRKVQREEETSLSCSHNSPGLQLTTPTMPALVGKSQGSGETPALPVTSLTKERKGKDTPTAISDMISSIMNATHKSKAQNMQPLQLAQSFDHLNIFGRSSSKSATPKTTQSSLNSAKNAKSISLNKSQSQKGRLSKAIQEQNDQRNNSGLQTRRATHHPLTRKKVVNEDVDTSISILGNKSFTKEKGPASSFLTASDRLAHLVVSSVMDDDQGDSKINGGYPHFDHIHGNNPSSFFQELMAELEQGAHNTSPPSGQMLQYNGARPKERQGNSTSKQKKSSPKSNRHKNKSTSASTGYRERVSPRTQMDDTSTHTIDFSPNSGSISDGSFRAFLDDNPHATESENFSHRSHKFKTVSDDDSQIFSPTKHFESHSQSRLTSLLDSFNSPSPLVHTKLLNSKGDDFPSSDDVHHMDLVDNSAMDCGSEDLLDDRELGDGQASEDVQTFMQNMTFRDNEDSDQEEEEVDDGAIHSQQDFFNQFSSNPHQHSSDLDLQPAENKFLITKSYSIPNESDDMFSPTSLDKFRAEALSVVSRLEYNDDDLLKNCKSPNKPVDHFQMLYNNANEEEENVNPDDSFSPLKHGICLDNKSPVKPTPSSNIAKSLYHSPDYQTLRGKISSMSTSNNGSRTNLMGSTVSDGINNEIANLLAQKSLLFDGLDD